MQALATIPHALDVMRIAMNRNTHYLGPSVGDYKLSAQSSDFRGWLICDGRELSSTDYPELFEVLGDAFGGGEGSFNLPDVRGRVPAAAGQSSGTTNHAFGQSIGAETHTLTVPEMPAHAHGITDPGHAHLESGKNSQGLIDSGIANNQSAANDDNGYTNSSTTGITINSAGGGQPHNNMQPTIFVGNMFVYAGVRAYMAEVNNPPIVG